MSINVIEYLSFFVFRSSSTSCTKRETPGLYCQGYSVISVSDKGLRFDPKQESSHVAFQQHHSLT